MAKQNLYTIFPHLTPCAQMTAWSQRSAWSKEDIVIIYALKNESQMSARCQMCAGAQKFLKFMNAGALIQGNMVCDNIRF